MKPTALAIRIRRALLLLLLVWIMASPLYYIEHLFSPSFYMGYDEGVLHKTVKYVICVFFTLALCLVGRAYSMLLGIMLMILMSILLVMNRGGLEISTLSILITAAMVSFALVPTIWETELRRIARIAVYAGTLVGVFSVLELTILAHLFESYWTSTNAIRSISTMFNPNNLGMYTGACLLLLPFIGLRPIPMSVCGALICFALIASGSRTAWVSAMVVLGYQFLTSKNLRISIIRLIRHHTLHLILPAIAFAAVTAAYQVFNTEMPEIEVANRGADLYTASVRVDNFIHFIKAIDIGIFLPDLVGQRADFIQDNLYLVVLNSFGVIGIIMFLIFFFTHFSLRNSTNPDMAPWKLIFAFYMLSGMGGSPLNSFPNNQMFFLSLGAVFALNVRSLRRATPPPPITVGA